MKATLPRRDFSWTFILASIIFLGRTSASALIWAIDVVDDSADVGIYSSLALDSDDDPRIAYHQSAYSDHGRLIKYAQWNGTAWEIQEAGTSGQEGTGVSLALDAQDNPHIFHFEWGTNQSKYTTWNGAAWVGENVGGPGYEGDLELDASGNPHVSYFIRDVNNTSILGDLRYANNMGSGWVEKTVESAGWVGRQPSLELDGAGTPHIAYNGVDDETLKYAKWNGTGWDTQVVDTIGGEYHGFSPGEASLAIDAEGDPHISYFDGISAQLKYAVWNGLSWLIDTIAPANVGNTSLALDSQGKPHIAFTSGGVGVPHTQYAAWNGSAWTVEDVDLEDNYLNNLSLALDKNDMPHISYYGANNGGKLKYASGRPDTTPPVQPIPEPATIGLMSIGLACIIGRKLKKSLGSRLR